MTPEDSAFLQHVGDVMGRSLVRPIADAITFGGSLGLFSLGLCIFWKRGVSGKSGWFMLLGVISCFALGIANFVGTTAALAAYPRAFSSPDYYLPSITIESARRLANTSKSKYANVYILTEALALGISDAVVIWRTHVLFPESRRLIAYAPIVLLVASCASRITAFAVNYRYVDWHHLPQMIKIGLVIDSIGQSLSFVTNSATTALVGVKLWSHRRRIIKHLNAHTAYTPAEKKLILLVETGALFCVVQLLVVFFSLALKGPMDTTCHTCFLASEVSNVFQFFFAANYFTILMILARRDNLFGHTDVLGSGALQSNGGEPIELVEFRNGVAS